MKIEVLGSSSEGNCYILNKELLLDAGVPLKEIKKALDFDFSRIQGVLLTHSHKDHSKSVFEIAKMGINCYMAEETALEIRASNAKIVGNNQFKIGKYIIMPFDCKHDVKCIGYLIYDTCTKEKLLFATDTCYLPYQFPGVHYFLIEANYSEQIINKQIEANKLEFSTARRIYHTHFSLENCIDFLHEQGLFQTKKIILIHLSDRNSNELVFQKKIIQEFGIDAIVAIPGLILELCIEPHF